jgi:hypothetical protein
MTESNIGDLCQTFSLEQARSWLGRKMLEKRTLQYIVIASFMLTMVACMPTPALEPMAQNPSASSLPTTAAPLVGPIIPTGHVIPRDLTPTTEIVPNCSGGVGTVIKHPSRSVLTNYAVEWEVGGTIGFGVVVGEGVVPAGINLTAALEGHHVVGIDQGIQQSTAWQLPAGPNTIVEYTLMWREEWQPGKVEVKFVDQSVLTINVLYRTGVDSDIISQRALDCSGNPIASITPSPTESAVTPPEVVVQPTPPSSENESSHTYPRRFLSDGSVPNGPTMTVDVKSGEIHVIAGGPMCIMERCLPSGEDRGSVVILLPTASYDITGLVPTQNWHGGFYGSQWELLAETSVASMKSPGNCTGGRSCSIVDVLVVGPGGVISQYTR